MTSPADEPPVGQSRRVPPYRNPFVWAFLVGIVTLTAMRPLLRHIPDPPPVVGDTPSFVLTDQDGHRFGRDEILGRVTIASFFCTRCGSSSPAMIAGLRRIQDAYKERGIDRIGLLSISVDPDADTPERLRDYARAIGADAGRWTFLTGDGGVVRRLASDLFKGVGRTVATNARPLVLIDQYGRIRGWYGTDDMGLDEVYNRAQHVLAQSAREP